MIAITNSLGYNRLIPITMGIIACGLLTIWALPGTIALRHILLGLGFILGLYYLKSHLASLNTIHSWPLWLLLSLYLWLILHLLFFSSQPNIQFQELKSIWARSFLALPLGLALGILLTSPTFENLKKLEITKEWVSFFLFLGFLSTPLIFMGVYLHKSYLAQQLLPMQAAPWFMTPYLQKPPFVVASALLLPMCCVLLLGVFRGQYRFYWALLAIFAICLCVASNYLANTKNGMAIIAITVGLFTLYSFSNLIVNWARHSISKGLISLILAISLLSGIGWGITLHIEKNPAWTQLISNAKVGIDIEHQNFWKNRYVYSAVPINEKGSPVDVSTYERTAWFTAGIKLLTDKPEGFGLVHHSFGWIAKERWSDFYPPIGTLRGMTHSGWMDLTLGIGIPGLLLILIPLGASWYRSLGVNGLWYNYTTWAIPIFVLTYLTTEVIGAHHFIELLIFMTAFFIGITLNRACNAGLLKKVSKPN